ncbi:hypothetical protein HJFPF1_00388 [Paramyrothecium foliicola]|nr:hypothetical protein HJFPF1_00388 [Paramyrothecium foliicola]
MVFTEDKNVEESDESQIPASLQDDARAIPRDGRPARRPFFLGDSPVSGLENGSRPKSPLASNIFPSPVEATFLTGTNSSSPFSGSSPPYVTSDVQFGNEGVPHDLTSSSLLQTTRKLKRKHDREHEINNTQAPTSRFSNDHDAQSELASSGAQDGHNDLSEPTANAPLALASTTPDVCTIEKPKGRWNAMYAIQSPAVTIPVPYTWPSEVRHREMVRVANLAAQVFDRLSIVLNEEEKRKFMSFFQPAMDSNNSQLRVISAHPIFLDHKNDPSFIRIIWTVIVFGAKKVGSAISLQKLLKEEYSNWDPVTTWLPPDRLLAAIAELSGNPSSPPVDFTVTEGLPGYGIKYPQRQRKKAAREEFALARENTATKARSEDREESPDEVLPHLPSLRSVSSSVKNVEKRCDNFEKNLNTFRIDLAKAQATAAALTSGPKETTLGKGSHDTLQEEIYAMIDNLTERIAELENQFARLQDKARERPQSEAATALIAGDGKLIKTDEIVSAFKVLEDSLGARLVKVESLVQSHKQVLENSRTNKGPGISRVQPSQESLGLQEDAAISVQKLRAYVDTRFERMQERIFERIGELKNQLRGA